MITPEQHAEIRRLYYGEHWKVGTIAAALGVHHDTVRAALVNDTQGVRRGACRTTQLDPYLPFVRDTLAQFPRLRATRVFEMVKARGYAGSVVQLRRAVRLIRPAATATVYRRLITLAAEEAQVDWGAFGSIRIGRGVRPVSGFVMVLAYSRAIFALFTLVTAQGAVVLCRSVAVGLAMSRPSRRGRASRAPWSTTTCAAPSSNAPAPQFAFIHGCSSSPATITSRRAPARRDAPMRRAKSSARFSTSDTPSLRRAPLSTSRI